MVFKTIINQSQVTLVHSNDLTNRRAYALYPFPYRQAISYSQASDPRIVLDGGWNLMKEQGAAKVMIATCSRQWTSNLFSICHLINEK